MRCLTFIFLFVCSQFSFAQTYHPFVVENAFWRFLYATGSDGNYYPSIKELRIQGDTSINNVYYKKLIYNDGYFIDSIFAIREDSLKRVYLRGNINSQQVSFCEISDSVDILIYDFGADIGDTVFLNTCNEHYYVVDSYDSINISGQTHKVVNNRFFVNSVYSSSSFYIETIGDINWFLYFIQYHEGLGFEHDLGCYSNDSIFYLNPIFANCNTLSIENNPSPAFSIFPNPASNQITIEQLSVTGNQLSVEVYDAVGRLVFASPLTPLQGERGTNRSVIDVSGFSKGIYLLAVKEKKEVVFWEKVVIEE